MYKYAQRQAMELQLDRLEVAADIIQDAAYEIAADIDDASITELILASKMVEGLIQRLQNETGDHATKNVVNLFS